MNTAVFWKAALERAVRTGAQFALWALGVGAVAGQIDSEQAQTLNAFLMDYTTMAGQFLAGMIFSVLTSLAFHPPEAQTTTLGPSDTPPRHSA